MNRWIERERTHAIKLKEKWLFYHSECARREYTKLKEEQKVSFEPAKEEDIKRRS